MSIKILLIYIWVAIPAAVVWKYSLNLLPAGSPEQYVTAIGGLVYFFLTGLFLVHLEKPLDKTPGT